VPFRKNLLLAQALQTSRASAAFPAYIEALEYRSVIGQVETVDALGKFVLNLFETVHKKGDPETFPISQVRILVDAHNTWFDETFPALPSDGSVYINGAVNIEAGLTFGQDDYVERGKTLYEAVLARNPTRIEFVKVLLRLAKAQDDQDAYERYRVMAITLRPDLEWE
jgi:hypothetical protein